MPNFPFSTTHNVLIHEEAAFGIGIGVVNASTRRCASCRIAARGRTAAIAREENLAGYCTCSTKYECERDACAWDAARGTHDSQGWYDRFRERRRDGVR